MDRGTLHASALGLLLLANLAFHGVAQSDDVYFTVPIRSLTGSGAEASLRVQLATNDEERKAGLMYRTSLPQGTGMLFLYEQANKRGLWMKNCDVKLDAAWFTPDGVLSQVVDLEPEDLVPKFSQRSDIPIALETDQGFFAAHGLKPGDARLDFTAVREALLSRDVDVSKFGFLAEPTDGASFATPDLGNHNQVPETLAFDGAKVEVAPFSEMASAPVEELRDPAQIAGALPVDEAGFSTTPSSTLGLAPSPAELPIFHDINSVPLSPVTSTTLEATTTLPIEQASPVSEAADEDPPLQFSDTPTLVSTKDAQKSSSAIDVDRNPMIFGESAPAVELAFSYSEDHSASSGKISSAANTLHFLAPDSPPGRVVDTASSFLARARGSLVPLTSSDEAATPNDGVVEPDIFDVVAKEAQAAQSWASLRVGPSFAHD